MGVDLLLFAESVEKATNLSQWPGRTSPQTATSILIFSIAVALTRVDRGGISRLWSLCLLLAAAFPFAAFFGYLFESLLLISTGTKSGMAFPTAAALLLLVAATLLSRPDRNPVAWLLVRPDRQSLVRMLAILAGIPLSIALLRAGLQRAGLEEHTTWALAIIISALAIGFGAFYLSQHEQGILIEKELLSRQRAEAEARYRILAENAVDVVVRLRGHQIAWISPSVESAFGEPPHHWIGSDLMARVHPDDRNKVLASLDRLKIEKSAQARFRLRNGDYHWVEGHGKRYIDGQSNSDDVIIALRIADAQVAAERELQRLARFDALTGLANRAETLCRFEASLNCLGSPGDHVGVLFCDADHFKAVNDTWGHLVGDEVLLNLADRMIGCTRPADTVGRIGGDEFLVLLPGVSSLDEVIAIAEEIRSRVSEPMLLGDRLIQISMSVGAILADPDQPMDKLIARADQAMYCAKRAGGNTVIRI
jgi:diguanylate cyclase (GGDEF)-like protein/PAS domain S-box-containing protein